MVLKGIVMVLKEPCVCPYFDHVAYILTYGSNGLERSQDPLLFTVWMPYLSKNGWIMQGNDLTDCLQLGIN